MNKLNIFKPQMKIRIKDHQTGEFHEGTINSYADWGIDPCWWVSFMTKEGVVDTTLASESDLILWNFGDGSLNSIKCSCGSAAVKHPGHAYHCLLVINGLVVQE